MPLGEGIGLAVDTHRARCRPSDEWLDFMGVPRPPDREELYPIGAGHDRSDALVSWRTTVVPLTFQLLWW